MIKGVRQTDEFTVAADDGRRFRVFEFTEFVDASSHDDPRAVVPGLKSLKTDQGFHVNFKAPGLFEIVELRLPVRRIQS